MSLAPYRSQVRHHRSPPGCWAISFAPCRCQQSKVWYTVRRTVASAAAQSSNLRKRCTQRPQSRTMARTAATGADARWQIFFTVGFCGAFTTFSSWILDITKLAEQASWRSATDHVVASLALGLAGFALACSWGGICPPHSMWPSSPNAWRRSSHSADLVPKDHT